MSAPTTTKEPSFRLNQSYPEESAMPNLDDVKQYRGRTDGTALIADDPYLRHNETTVKNRFAHYKYLLSTLDKMCIPLSIYIYI
ncbi:hypothetical protein KIPB_011353 [Kipferlia bialata]|uniref:Uncharacterized protein n=1 Tax=Kipferlia bialata TaxID=797122 RepID=A0A9K3D847_9EUKA|nr:hypothetical protein KIPB_011353 [Kipferlia bialata]|eukprot:g11353.t1